MMTREEVEEITKRIASYGVDCFASIEASGASLLLVSPAGYAYGIIQLGHWEEFVKTAEIIVREERLIGKD